MGFPVRIKRKILKRPEQDLQIAFVRWFKYKYPNFLIWHTPNQGKKSPRLSGIFKGLGVLSGVPDLFIVEKSKGYVGMFLELKAKNKTLSDNQEEVMRRLSLRGFYVTWADDIEKAIYLTDNYLSDCVGVE